MDVFEGIIQGLEEAVEYNKGNLKVKTHTVSVTPIKKYTAADIKSIRNKLELTQNLFAMVMGVSIKTVEAWEKGTNVPNGSAQRLLYIISNEPNLLKSHQIVTR